MTNAGMTSSVMRDPVEQQSLLSNTDQINNRQALFKLHCHWIMFQSHEDYVDDEADDDHKVEERVCDEGREPLFEPPPTAAAVPGQEDRGQDGATWRSWALLSRL